MIFIWNYHYSAQLNVRKVGIKYKYENYRIEVRWHSAGVIPCDILVTHIDSRIKIIDNERPGASPCDLLLVSVRLQYASVVLIKVLIDPSKY